MASTFTVKVHPVVYLTIVDAFERRSNKPGANDKALGTLMGFYEKNAIQVIHFYSDKFQVMHCSNNQSRRVTDIDAAMGDL